MLLRSLAAALLGLLVVVPSAQANFITNGGFETGDFTGWTVSDSHGVFVEPAGFAGYSAHSGAYFAALGSIGTDGTLSQTVADTPGQLVVLDYFLASNGTGPADFIVDWDGLQIPGSVLSNPDSSSAYVEYSFRFLATGSDTVTFFERNDPNILALDDVSLNVVALTGVPEPLTLSLFGTGLVGALAMRRRKAKSA